MGIIDTVTTETGIMATTMITMTEAEVTEEEDEVGEEEDSEVVEVTEEAGSTFREAGPSLTLPREETFSLRRRIEAGAADARESIISTRGSCSNTGQVRVRVLRRTKWSMGGGRDRGQGPGQDLDL